MADDIDHHKNQGQKGFSPSLCPKYPEILLPSTGFHDSRPFLKSIPVDSRSHLNMSQR